MRTLPWTWGAVSAVACAGVILGAGACGSRTGLGIPEESLVDEAGFDVVIDRRRDTSPDTIPGLDARPRPDVVRNDCPDAAATLIYVITTQYDLFSFNPASGGFSRIGAIVCPSNDPTATPFSMAVDRHGIAYVVYNDGELFRVSNLTAACTKTAFRTGQAGISTFGMGFTSNTGGAAETLFIASDATGGSTLGTIDVTTFALGIVGPIDSFANSPELTGSGDGRLFAFYALANGPGTAIGELEKTTGRVLSQNTFPNVDRGNQWAFGYWGGDFYMFTGQQGAGSDVTRYRPSDGSVRVIAHLPEDIVGAGVSTCAPEQ